MKIFNTCIFGFSDGCVDMDLAISDASTFGGRCDATLLSIPSCAYIMRLEYRNTKMPLRRSQPIHFGFRFGPQEARRHHRYLIVNGTREEIEQHVKNSHFDEYQSFESTEDSHRLQNSGGSSRAQRNSGMTTFECSLTTHPASAARSMNAIRASGQLSGLRSPSTT